MMLLLISTVLVACGESAPPASEVQDTGATEIASTPPAMPVEAEPSASWAEARAAAMMAINVAAAKRHAWSTSDSLLQEAARAAGEGDESRAISLADEARIHAELAAIQADREAAAWHDIVIGN
jgi:hypothetical protein